MIFVPCLSVDKNLTRLGYGGGYFDTLRRNNDWRNVPCIGVLTSNCVSTIPLTRAEWEYPTQLWLMDSYLHSWKLILQCT